MFKRRDFLKAAGSSIVAGGLVSTPAMAKKVKYRWRLVMAVPKTLPLWGEGVLRFAEQVKRLSGGSLDIRVYGGGELVPSLGVLDAVSAGRVEMGHSASYYWQGKVPSSVFFTCIPFGLTTTGFRAWMIAGGGQELWDEAYSKFGVLALPAGNTGMQMGGWFNKKINSIKDFNGLKMRIPGLGGAVVEKAGAKPMLMAGSEIYTNLSTGVIDATEWVGPYHDYLLGLHKIAKYYYAPGFHEPGANLELMINMKKWASLPEDLRELVRVCAAQLDRDMHAQWVAKDVDYLDRLKREGKVQVLNFPSSVQKELRRYSDEVLVDLAKKDAMAKKILSSFEAFRTKYESYYKTVDLSYWQHKFQS